MGVDGCTDFLGVRKVRDHKFAIQVLETAIEDLDAEEFYVSAHGDGVMEIVIRQLTETIKLLKIDQDMSKGAV